MVSLILVEFIKGAADKAGVQYTLGTETEGKHSPELLRSVITEMRDGQSLEAIDDPFVSDAAPAPEPEEEPVVESLMARRSA